MNLIEIYLLLRLFTGYEITQFFWKRAAEFVLITIGIGNIDGVGIGGIVAVGIVVGVAGGDDRDAAIVAII